MNLSKVAEALRALADAIEEDAPVRENTTKPAKAEKPRAKKPDPKPEPEPEQEVDTETKSDVTKEQVIQALQAVAKSKGRARIDRILADFNVDKVSALAESDYADVVQLAEAAVDEG